MNRKLWTCNQFNRNYIPMEFAASSNSSSKIVILFWNISKHFVWSAENFWNCWLRTKTVNESIDTRFSRIFETSPFFDDKGHILICFSFRISAIFRVFLFEWIAASAMPLLLELALIFTWEGTRVLLRKAFEGVTRKGEGFGLSWKRLSGVVGVEYRSKARNKPARTLWSNSLRPAPTSIAKCSKQTIIVSAPSTGTRSNLVNSSSLFYR